MKPKLFLVVAVIVLLAGLAGGGWYWYERQHSAVGDTLVLHGNVDIREVELAFNASDRIEQILSSEGDRVTAGQLLALLDSRRLRHAVGARRRLRWPRSARSSHALCRVQTRGDPQGAGGRRGGAGRRGERRADLRRTLDLVAQHFVAQQQADNAKGALDAAQARLRQPRSAAAGCLGPRKEDIAAAKATLAAYEAALAIAQRDLAGGSLVAPADGVIENRMLEPGDMASPQAGRSTLALTEPLWVRAYVPEPDLGKLRLGMPAQITTDSYPGQALPRLDRLHLAHRGVHAQVGRDAGGAHCARLSGARVRLPAATTSCAWACPRPSPSPDPARRAPAGAVCKSSP